MSADQLDGPNREQNRSDGEGRHADEELERQDVDPHDFIHLLLQREEDEQDADEKDDSSDYEEATGVLGLVIPGDVPVVGFAGKRAKILPNQALLVVAFAAKRASLRTGKIDAVAFPAIAR